MGPIAPLADAPPQVYEYILRYDCGTYHSSLCGSVVAGTCAAVVESWSGLMPVDVSVNMV